MTLGKSLSHPLPHYFKSFYTLLPRIVSFNPHIKEGVGQSVTYHSHFMEGETEVQRAQLQACPRSHCGAEALAKPGV